MHIQPIWLIIRFVITAAEHTRNLFFGGVSTVLLYIPSKRFFRSTSFHKVLVVKFA